VRPQGKTTQFEKIKTLEEQNMEPMSVIIFVLFVALVLILSLYFAKKSKSASGYFVAGGTIHWAVNGIAFAGDYLSAASFLGICGMIATVGYDGFLYSIGYLAGWVVALFVIAEPLKRLGKYTFADALDAKFNSKGIQLTAAISTLIVSICYLIPQMVGAGSLVTPLLGLSHSFGVILVGSIVIFIVATAGMTSTTYVQFIKGALLIVFSTILVIAVLGRGVSTRPDQNGKVPHYAYRTLEAVPADQGLTVEGYHFLHEITVNKNVFVKLWRFKPVQKNEAGTWVFNVKNNLLVISEPDKFIDAFVGAGGEKRVIDDKKVLVQAFSWWKKEVAPDGKITLAETQWVTDYPDGGRWVNGAPASDTNQLRQVGTIDRIGGEYVEPTLHKGVGPFKFLSLIGNKDTVIRLWKQAQFKDSERNVTVHYPVLTGGNRVMRPGLKFNVGGTPIQRIEFLSLMMALFFGTAALPHILIRYYTVRSPACARKSTIVAIAAIGFFYILTLYMGLGAMINGVINLNDSNMSAPLLARSFGTFLFSIISAIAFATVLGTVSGLIIASSGAIAHDLIDRFGGMNLNEKQQVIVGRLSAFAVGLVAIILGIVFKGMNVSFLVGWAFAVAASANLPAIIMLLFWKKTTAQGISASIIVGIISALGIILLSPEMWVRYGLPAEAAPSKLGQPGIVSIPLSFMTLVIVSLLTQKKKPLASKSK
jgi:cation/acetate symporter